MPFFKTKKVCKETAFLYTPNGIGKNGQNEQISTSAKKALLKGISIARRKAALYREAYIIRRGWILLGVKKRIFRKTHKRVFLTLIKSVLKRCNLGVFNAFSLFYGLHFFNIPFDFCFFVCYTLCVMKNFPWRKKK